MLLPRCARSASRIIIENGNAVRSVTRKTQAMTTGARLTRPIPSRSTATSDMFCPLPSALCPDVPLDKSDMPLDKEGPGEELILQPHEPCRRPFGCGTPASRLGGEAVVREIRVEHQNLIGIDLRRHHAARVLERDAMPPAGAVPGEAPLLAVRERGENRDGENSVTMTPHDNHIRKHLIIGAGARDAVDAVVEHHRSPVNLIEERREIPS